MMPVPGVQRIVGWPVHTRAYAENRGERRHWVEAPVEPKHILVEIGRQVLRADAMMGAEQPRLQVREDEVNHRQHLLCLFRVAVEHDALVSVAHGREMIVSLPAIGGDLAVRLDVVGDKRFQGSLAAILQNLQAQTPGVDGAAAALALLLAHLDCASNVHLVMNAASFAARLAADERLIQLDRPLCANTISVGANHADTQLMQQQERRLIAAHSKLALELQCRHAWRLRRHKVGSPEPDLQRCAGRVHNGPRSEVGISLALPAPQNRRAILEAVCLCRCATLGANKTIGPAGSLQVVAARPLIREPVLKFQQSRRKRLDHARTRPIVALGVNRIGMVQTTGATSVGSTLLSFRLSPFQDDEGFVRHLLTCRSSGEPRIAASLYESYLSLKTDSHKGRSATLYALATLYSWAESVDLELDSLLVGGLGLVAPEVSAFSMWLRTRLGNGNPERLSSEARHNHNQILHFCRQACVYFITQYGPADRTADRVRQIELLARAQERSWQKQRLKQRKPSVAPDLSDDELRRIEAFLLPQHRASSVGEAVAHRDYFIWRLTIEFGLRIGEILSLRLQDCPAQGRDFLSVVRIEERTDGVVDPRGANAPRPKTLSRDLHPLWSGSSVFRLIGTYSSRFRRTRVKEHERHVFRWVLPHPFLIVATNGNPLSISATQDIACAIKAGTGIDFHWHLGRHAFFNRMYQLAKTNQEQQDLVYWGGWESEKSLLIYSRKARADRARRIMRTENEKWAWMQLS